MVLKKFFRSPPVGDLILKAIYKLKVQCLKLEQVTVRLQDRDKVLFKKCTLAIQDKNKERAIVFANELAEVRKLLSIVSHTQIVIERLIIRLETIKELNTIMTDIKPMLGVLRDVANCISKVMPEVACELDRVNDSISETLIVSKISSEQQIVPVDLKTPEREEILQEVSKFLEQQLAEKLPEPPPSVTVTEKAEPVGNVRQMVAVAASCSEVCGQKEPQKYVSYKDMELQRVSVRVRESSSLEDVILEYARKRDGQVDVTQCALELNVSPNDVEQVLERLGTQGKIKIEQ